MAEPPPERKNADVEEERAGFAASAPSSAVPADPQTEAIMQQQPEPSPPSPPPELPPDEYKGHHHYVLKRLRRRLPPLSPRRKLLVSVALCVSMILCGWNDGSVGPLFPTLQEYYGISYLVMSLIYTTGFAGSIFGALINIWLTDRIGFGLVTPLAALSNAIAFMLAGTGAPFGVFLTAFAFNGFGLSIQDAQVNNLATRLPNPAVLMSFVQASFSGGATVAPFLATAFAQHLPKRSYLYFLVAMGVALIAMAILLVAFKGMTEEQIVGTGSLSGPADSESASTAPAVSDSKDATVLQGTEKEKDTEGEVKEKEPTEANEESAQAVRASTPPAISAGIVAPANTTIGAEGEAVVLDNSSGAKLKRILRRPAIYALMAWSFLYIGLEVGTSSWLTTFLIRERGASAAAGYAVTGFWGAMTVGRILLIPVTHKIGSQTAIYAYSVIALALEFVIWFTHSVPGNAVCFALIGFFLGPIYPSALLIISETWSEELVSGVMGFLGSVGGAGAALGPFIMGAVSDVYGIWTIQPIAVAMIAGFTILWAISPKPPFHAKQTDGNSR